MKVEEVRVKLIYSKNLSDPTGASSVMRQLHNACDLFKSKDIILDVISRENLHKPTNAVSLNSNNKVSIKKSFMRFLDKQSKRFVLAFFIKNYIESFRAAKSIVAYANSRVEKDEILFFHELFTAYFYLKKYGKTNKAVLVLHNDGEDFKLQASRCKGFKGSWYNKYLQNVLDFCLQRVDRIGFVAERSRRTFLSNHTNINQDNTFVAYNGLQRLPFLERDWSKKLTFVCVGTVINTKGQQFIIDALIRLRKEHPNCNIKVVIVGGGPMLPELKAKADENGLGDLVNFTGSTNQVDEILKTSHIYILPSLSEGLPMAILEAMRMSLPIVATRVGGIPETIVEGQTGLHIESTADSVYDIFVRNDIDWQKMAIKSHELFLSRFSVETMIDSYSKVFKNL